MDKDKLDYVRNWLIDNLFRSDRIMFEPKIREAELDPERSCDLIEVIAYLYNRLHEVVTGEEYNYFYHWGNHIGYSVEDVPEIENTIYTEV